MNNLEKIDKIDKLIEEIYANCDSYLLGRRIRGRIGTKIELEMSKIKLKSKVNYDEE